MQKLSGNARKNARLPNLVRRRGRALSVSEVEDDRSPERYVICRQRLAERFLSETSSDVNKATYPKTETHMNPLHTALPTDA